MNHAPHFHEADTMPASAPHRTVSEKTRLRHEQKALRKRMAKAKATLKLRDMVADLRIEVEHAENEVRNPRF
jgi:predicted  nucleic acid-binding Zn-ribbon protein